MVYTTGISFERKDGLGDGRKGKMYQIEVGRKGKERMEWKIGGRRKKLSNVGLEEWERKDGVGNGRRGKKG